MDNSLLQNIPSLAIWGSIITTAVMGSYMLAQALLDKQRRAYFMVFALSCFTIVTLDISHSDFSNKNHYEIARIIIWMLYFCIQLRLLESSAKVVWSIYFGLVTLGITIGLSYNLAIGSTITFAIGNTLVAYAFGYRYWKTQGYASCILCTFSLMMAILCAMFYHHLQISMQQNNMLPIFIGFFHVTVLAISSVLFGWIYLPRELRGLNPVTIKKSHGIIFFSTMIGLEIMSMIYIHYYNKPHEFTPFFGILGAIVICTLIIHFYYRHLLVIRTDNIAGLLKERTADLRLAQEKLTQQNKMQAHQIDDQTDELKSKVEIIQRQQRLELAAQTAGQVAHDIQNLIAPMLTYTKQLQEPVNSDTVNTNAEKLQQQAERLLDLNNQLLAMGRRGRLERYPINLRELLEEVLDRFPTKNISLEAEPDIWINGSSAQLTRAISNLISNALDASMHNQTAVTITCKTTILASAKRCHLGFVKAGDHAMISIADAGAGISTESIDKIFDPFYSSKSNIMRSGSGLGLSIVTAVVDDHQAVLDLHTDKHGTVFTLYFPLITKPSTHNNPETLTGTASVLLIDDDMEILQLFGQLLEEYGYTVTTATDGNKAMQILQAEDIDLLVLDLKMPGKTGHDTFYGAMHLRPGIQAIVHSSYVTNEESEQLYRLGIAEILQKPASKLEFLKTVHRTLELNGVKGDN